MNDCNNCKIKDCVLDYSTVGCDAVNMAYTQGRMDEKTEILEKLLAVTNPCDNCYSGFCESCRHNGEYAMEMYLQLHQLKEQNK